jgi:hypothetical protein
VFSPGIFWSGLSLNRFGWEVQHLIATACRMPGELRVESNFPRGTIASSAPADMDEHLLRHAIPSLSRADEVIK